MINRITAGAPLRQLFLIEAVRHVRMPLAGYWSDYRIRIELAAIDAHRAAEAAANVKCRLDDCIACEARQDWFEIGDFPGQAAAIPCLLVLECACVLRGENALKQSMSTNATVPGVRARVAPGGNLSQPAKVMGPAFRMAGALLGIG